MRKQRVEQIAELVGGRRGADRVQQAYVREDLLVREPHPAMRGGEQLGQHIVTWCVLAPRYDGREKPSEFRRSRQRARRIAWKAQQRLGPAALLVFAADGQPQLATDHVKRQHFRKLGDEISMAAVRETIDDFMHQRRELFGGEACHGARSKSRCRQLPVTVMLRPVHADEGTPDGLADGESIGAASGKAVVVSQEPAHFVELRQQMSNPAEGAHGDHGAVRAEHGEHPVQLGPWERREAEVDAFQDVGRLHWLTHGHSSWHCRRSLYDGRPSGASAAAQVTCVRVLARGNHHGSRFVEPFPDDREPSRPVL